MKRNEQCSSPQAQIDLESLDRAVLVEIILQQRQIIEELRGALADVQAKYEDLHVKHEELQAKYAALKSRLDKNSNNSHKPPSSDGPSVPKKRGKKKGKRRRGGQPGHKGKCRNLVPADEVDKVEDVRPDRCKGCGEHLEGRDDNPARHQVTEIPPIQPIVTEYQLHALTCERCGTVTRAELPAGVPQGSFGPRLVSIIALFSGAYRLSKRNIQAILTDCFGVEMSVGSVCAAEQQVSAALADPVEEAKEHVRSQQVAHVDETGWREANKKAWLWTAVTHYVTVFLIRCSRGAKVAKELLGETYAAYLVSDRWGGYNWVDTSRRQLCWAHLLRDFEGIAECEGTTGRRGRRLANLGRLLFEYWGRVRDGTLARSSFQTYASRIRVKVRGLLERIEKAGGPKSGMAKKILRLEPAMWTFVRVAGISPTNNAAERAIRPVVLWRKGSFGTQSKKGSAFAERILSTVATLRQQNRNVLGYLTQAYGAHLTDNVAPSLLPAQ